LASMDPLGVNVAPMTGSQAIRVKDRARTLGAPRTSRVEADAPPVAGEAMDRHGVPFLRLILSSVALLILYTDPSESSHLSLTYTTLLLYTLYSAGVYLAAARRWMLPKGAAHWIDVAWHTVLVSSSGGSNSLFFVFYFFDILVASFRLGAAEGLRVTAVSAALFTSVGYAVAPASDFELNRFLLRPVSLLVLGYMIAYWGGLENQSRRRIALLKDVTVLSNPRFGVYQTIWSALERLRDYYDADECLLALADGADRGYRLVHARRGDTCRSHTDSCSSEMAAVLLAPPYSLAMLVERRRVWSWWGPRVYVRDVVTNQTSRALPEAATVMKLSVVAPFVAATDQVMVLSPVSVCESGVFARVQAVSFALQSALLQLTSVMLACCAAAGWPKKARPASASPATIVVRGLHVMLSHPLNSRFRRTRVRRTNSRGGAGAVTS
jgi:hypothetical protein